MMPVRHHDLPEEDRVRLRCPNDGCTVEVADGLVGAGVRCPLCQQFLPAAPYDPKVGDLELPPTKPAGAPAAAQQPAPTKPAPPEKRLYAGLPPLAVLFGVRQGHGTA